MRKVEIRKRERLAKIVRRESVRDERRKNEYTIHTIKVIK